MRFKIDENLPTEVAEVLAGAGYDAHTVWDEGLAGEDDAVIVRRIQEEGRILITLDLDFADIRTYPPDQNPGFIVLRLKRQDKGNAMTVVTRLALALSRRSPVGELWIVEEDRIRFRQGERAG